MSLAGGQGPREVVQDLIRDLSVKRAYAAQYLRDPAHPDIGSHLRLGSQHRYGRPAGVTLRSAIAYRYSIRAFFAAYCGSFEPFQVFSR